jgi:hypothetical protein
VTTLNYVTVTWDELDCAGEDLAGRVTFTLSNALLDVPNGKTYNTPIRSYGFVNSTGSSDPLVANDNTAFVAGSYYTVTVAISGQEPYSFNAPINFANGASQTLTALQETAGSITPLYQYLPLPAGGPPAAGEVPVATGVGEKSVWTTVWVFPSGDTTGQDDYAAINSLLGNNVKVALQPGQFWLAQPIVPPQDITTWIDGSGKGVTILSPAAGANCDVIQGGNFSSLTNTGTGTATGAGPLNFQLSNLTIDGNRSGQTLTALANSACNPATPPPNGYGIRLYGRSWALNNIDVHNCFAYGMWTEWGIASGNQVPLTGSIEGRAVNIKVYENGVHGWYHRGPSDCQVSNMLCYSNNQAGLNAGIDFWGESDNITNGSGTNHFTPNGLQISNCHCWGSSAKWNMVLDCTASVSNSHAEGAPTGLVLMRGSVDWYGGTVYYISSQLSAIGCGVQFGDTGSTSGVPTTASFAASVKFCAPIVGILCDAASRAGIVWANSNQAIVKTQIQTKNAPTAQISSGSNGQTLPQATIFASGANALPPSGTVTIGPDTVTYTGNTGTSLTGCSGGTSLLSTGETVTLANVGTVPVSGTVNTFSDVSIELNGNGLATGVVENSSLHYSKGRHRFDVATNAGAVEVLNNGLDVFNINTASSRVEGPNGYEWRLYADNYTTRTVQIQGANGHIGTAPPNGFSVAFAAGASAGSGAPSPVAVSGSSDTQGQVGFGTGTSPSTGPQVTVTFAKSYTLTPVVILTSVNQGAAALQPYVSNNSSTGFNISFAVAPAASQAEGAYTMNYIVLARGA